MSKQKYKPSHVPDFRQFTQTVKAIVPRTAERMVYAFAKAECRTFKSRIRHQTFRSFITTPLTAKWLSRKAAAGADQRVMIATKHYVRSIRVFTKRTKRGVVIRVGFHPNTLARDLQHRVVQIPLWKLALVHEHGSAKMNIPPRPHWRPFKREMELQRVRPLRKTITRECIHLVRQHLRRIWGVKR